ncbi:hypothetical protein E4634_08160 [Mangrovimicrobium sediminis]|uniref:Uncharacterized protein n=1 Tax=Mangrovimicrobium sediminis TaxID=2562682 RepID=A0A4Z0M402_9GAMM|nr:hypothetical protein [Haliea sp. SAOS-164]TGD74098.1 hypothetical protein E4634_08160 [Haliea sp. SAOS-164]
MNANFKPLGLAAAVATATAGYAGVVNAQATLAGNTQLGDLAIVPYYTVMEGYATGVNVINTSGRTQAVKIRFRRAADSMDALDFNVVLSPYDMYTGFIQESGGDIFFISNDNSCTAPAYPAGGFKMPNIFREGAETGYIEILSMGAPIAETEAVAVSAKHDATGVPADCAGVRDNFFADGVSATVRGVVDSTTTVQNVAGVPTDNTWEEAPESLKVSYFIKDDDSGIEFGNNAVHIAEFLDGPAMTNQQRGVRDGDLLGFDHPNLDGGSPIGGGASIGLYEPLRVTLGAAALINDWSQNSTGTFSVDTDWVVTIPGQYLMMDLPQYIALYEAGTPELCTYAAGCDFRDIPMEAGFTVYDREERGITVDPGDLVVSPQPPEEIEIVALDKEVNVIQWGTSPVLDAPSQIIVDKPAGAAFGWSSLVATSSASKVQSICEYDLVNPLNPMTCTPTSTPAPLIGFAAWQRNFAELAEANYGRIVEHSRVQSSS